MWLSSPIRESIAAELRHMHRPEIADLVLAADFAVVGRTLMIDSVSLFRAEIRSPSNRVFFEHWICLAAMRTGIPIDSALIFPQEGRLSWQVNYFVDHGLAERQKVLLSQPRLEVSIWDSGFCLRP